MDGKATSIPGEYARNEAEIYFHCEHANRNIDRSRQNVRQ